MSPTVIRVTTVVLFFGTVAFLVAGFIGQTEDQSTGSVLLGGVVIGGPISAVVGVITGLFWEKLFGPIKSVEHLDMRKKHYKTRRQRAQSPEPEPEPEPDLRRASEPASERRYTGKGGGKRRR